MDYLKYCFTKKEIISNFKNDTQFDNWLRTRIKNKTIKKVHNGLYVTVDSMNNINATKFEIACKISDTAFLCYHSALEYYGWANQVYNEVFVGSTTRFNEFVFEGVKYNFINNKRQIEILDLKDQNIRITSIERTIIDCIDNTDLAGGIEEILSLLNNVKNLSENKILEILSNYNKVLLYQKVGYILEQFNDSLKLSEKFYKELQSHLTNQIKYFLNEEYDSVVYNSKWKLIAPKELKSIINEGM